MKLLFSFSIVCICVACTTATYTNGNLLAYYDYDGLSLVNPNGSTTPISQGYNLYTQFISGVYAQVNSSMYLLVADSKLDPYLQQINLIDGSNKIVADLSTTQPMSIVYWPNNNSLVIIEDQNSYGGKGAGLNTVIYNLDFEIVSVKTFTEVLYAESPWGTLIVNNTLYVIGAPYQASSLTLYMYDLVSESLLNSIDVTDSQISYMFDIDGIVYGFGISDVLLFGKVEKALYRIGTSEVMKTCELPYTLVYDVGIPYDGEYFYALLQQPTQMVSSSPTYYDNPYDLVQFDLNCNVKKQDRFCTQQCPEDLIVF